MADTPDIGSVVSMIMENPELIAQISEMARRREPSEGADPPEATEAVTASPSESPVSEASTRRIHRTKLANAMKPYLSPERAQAIDAMMSIADILEITRGRK